MAASDGEAAAASGAEGAAAADGVGEAVKDVGEAILDLINSGAAGPDRGKSAITDLQDARRVLAAQKRRLTQQLRNETKKRARMMNKSARLSTQDLVEVLHIRQSRVAAAKAKAQAAR